jgi:hypothetical protein
VLQIVVIVSACMVAWLVALSWQILERLEAAEKRISLIEESAPRTHPGPRRCHPDWIGGVDFRQRRGGPPDPFRSRSPN